MTVSVFREATYDHSYASYSGRTTIFSPEGALDMTFSSLTTNLILFRPALSKSVAKARLDLTQLLTTEQSNMQWRLFRMQEQSWES
jgi:hypothetical protein